MFCLQQLGARQCLGLRWGSRPGVEGHAVSRKCSSRRPCNCPQAKGQMRLATGSKLGPLRGPDSASGGKPQQEKPAHLWTTRAISQAGLGVCGTWTLPHAWIGSQSVAAKPLGECSPPSRSPCRLPLPLLTAWLLFDPKIKVSVAPSLSYCLLRRWKTQEGSRLSAHPDLIPQLPAQRPGSRGSASAQGNAYQDKRMQAEK